MQNDNRRVIELKTEKLLILKYKVLQSGELNYKLRLMQSLLTL